MMKLLLALAGILFVSPAFADSTLYSNSTTGDVGIGTASPLNPLDIYGQAVIGTGYAGVDTAPSNGLLVQGDVGIGTTTPQSLVQAYDGEVQVGSSGASCTTANNGAIRYSSGMLYYCNGTSWTPLGNGNGPTVSAYQSSAQSGISTSTWTKVNLQSTNWDTASGFNTGTSTYTCQAQGYYQVNGAVNTSAAASFGTNEFVAAIYQNGSSVLQGDDLSLTPQYSSIGVSGVVHCNVNDTVNLYVFQASGSNAALNASSYWTRMDITFLRGG